jgi:hypothetical protein
VLPRLLDGDEDCVDLRDGFRVFELQHQRFWLASS